MEDNPQRAMDPQLFWAECGPFLFLWLGTINDPTILTTMHVALATPTTNMRI